MKKINLKKVLDIKRGMSLSGNFYSDSGKYIRLTLGNFNYPNGGFKENTAKSDIFFSGPIRRKFVLKKGDIITPLTEQVRGLLGETATIPQDDCYIQSGDIGLVIPDERILDKRFAYYLVSSPPVKKQLAAGSQQTKIRHTSPDAIKDCVAWIPATLKEQHSIATLLDLIDGRLLTNDKTAIVLEAMAKTIYDYWFLQFDFSDENGRPYKSSGGKMVWNDELKREIPDDWEVKNLYGIADYANGIACQRFRPANNTNRLPVIKITEMHNGFTEKTEYVRDTIDATHIINDGDILFSWSASLEIMQWANGKGALNQHIFKVIPKVPSENYVYYQLSEYISNFVRIAEARKTTMGHITSDHLEQSRIVVPCDTILAAFQKQTEKLIQCKLTCQKQNRELTSLRDFLLPLLMNGQVTIKNAIPTEARTTADSLSYGMQLVLAALQQSDGYLPLNTLADMFAILGSSKEMQKMLPESDEKAAWSKNLPNLAINDTLLVQTIDELIKGGLLGLRTVNGVRELLLIGDWPIDKVEDPWIEMDAMLAKQVIRNWDERLRVKNPLVLRFRKILESKQYIAA